MLIFFINKYNDIDHIVPIIYKVSNETNKTIHVFCINPFNDISNDYRLNFLKNDIGVNVEYIYKSVNKLSVPGILSFFLCKDTGKKFSSLISLLCNNWIWFSKLIFKNIYGEKWCRNFFDKYKSHILILDGTTAVSKTFNFSAIETVANERSIPKISLPHGVALYSKHPRTYDNAKADLNKNNCEVIVSPSYRWMQECIDFGISPEKLKVVGVARHCKEWETVLQDIVPWEESLDRTPKGKLKVVYMDMGPNRYEEFKPIAEKTLRVINSLDFVHLLFKPHTRSNRANLEIPVNVENVHHINSHNLIKWADVVIGMSSSIILGVLMQNKVYISPTYFRRVDMIYEEHGACWAVDSEDELKKALISLKENPSLKPYSQESINNFLTEIIYAGEKDKDVLKSYKELIFSFLDKKKY
ncbi:hypothetical protein N9519_02605 [Candidatus Thioglobus sp.]|nr:hypothetical protein [Candidatus Thioglobus sp.]